MRTRNRIFDPIDFIFVSMAGAGAAEVRTESAIPNANLSRRTPKLSRQMEVGYKRARYRQMRPKAIHRFGQRF